MFRKILKVLTAAGVVLYVIGKIMTKQENLRGALLGTLGFFIALGCGLILFFLWVISFYFSFLLIATIRRGEPIHPVSAGIPAITWAAIISYCIGIW